MTDMSDADIERHLFEYEKYEDKLKSDIVRETNNVVKGWLEARLKSVNNRMNDLKDDWLRIT